MNRKTRNIICGVCAVLAVLCVFVACVFILNKDNTKINTTQSVSAYGTVESFDYTNFDYSSGLESNGYWTGVHAQDYITLPDGFDALQISKADVEPTEDEIQAQVESLLEQFVFAQAVTGRSAQDGDIVNIDFAGTVDGVAFTGGTYSGYDLTLGSGAFIEGFEEQILGHSVGETFDIYVTFPEGYSDSTDAEGNAIVMSGKDAVFTITVNSISEETTPELTDEWVDENFGTTDDMHTAQDVRDYFAETLYTNKLDNAVMDYLLENSKFADELPAQIMEYYICMFLNYQYQVASLYGLDLDTYAMINGYENADAMLAALDENLAKLVKQDLIFQAVAEKLEIVPTQEEIDNSIATYGETYGEERSVLNALQLAVLDTLEGNAVIV